MPDDNVTLAKLTGWTKIRVTPLFHVLAGIPPDDCEEDDVPRFTESLDAHRQWVWPLIEERKLWREYLDALIEIVPRDPVPLRWTFRITPEQHTRAAIKALGGEK